MQSSLSKNLWNTLPRLLYTHNPLYLVSALLVLVGLHQIFNNDGSLSGGRLLMSLLCGYIFLLAVVSYLIVRFGKVWDDARTILLVLLLLFFALSVSFDKLVLENPHAGAQLLFAGFAFVVCISEGVLHGLRIVLQSRWRLPLYLLLLLLFVYPVGLGWLSVEGRNAAMSMGVFAFPVVTAVALLSLLPAARSKQEATMPNGTPWNWPWFPWTIFVFLLLAFALRSYSLSMAFEAARGSAVSFQAFFLSPLVLAVAILLLEAGIAHRRLLLRQIALLLPVIVLITCLPGTRINPIADRFLSMLGSLIGSPAQIALVGCGLFYGLAWLRRISAGETGLLICLALTSGVDSQTLSLSTLTTLQPLPWALIAALELPLGIARRSSRRVITGSLAAIVCGASINWPSAVPAHATYILTHTTVVILLLLAALYDDPWARQFRRWAMALLPTAALVALAYEFVLPGVPFRFHVLYACGLSLAAILYWRRRRASMECMALLVTLCALTGLGSRGLYLNLEGSALQRGLPWLAAGTAALALAMLMSLTKGGVLLRVWRSLNPSIAIPQQPD